MKQWLEEHKIFFETVASVALTLMAIIVSLASLRVSERQLELAEAEIAPVFRLTGGSTFAGVGGFQTEEDQKYLEGFQKLFNDGVPIQWQGNGLEVETILILSGTSTSVGRWVRLRSPVEAKIRYTEDEEEIPARTGLLAEFRQVRWFLNGYDPLLRIMGSACNKHDRAACVARSEHKLSSIAKLSYVDKHGNQSDRYFELFVDRDGELSQDQLKTLFMGAKSDGPEFTLAELAKGTFAQVVEKANR